MPSTRPIADAAGPGRCLLGRHLRDSLGEREDALGDVVDVEADARVLDGDIHRPELLDAVGSGDASATVVNIWATWCQPCTEEFPDLLRLSRNYRGRGVRLVLVSADFDDSLASVKDYLAGQGVDFVSYLKSGDDMEFIDRLEPRWTGALPATFLYDGGGSLRDFWEGKASYETMEGRLQAVLGAEERPPGIEEDS